MNYLVDLIIIVLISFISYSNYKRGVSKLLIGVVVVVISLLLLLKFQGSLHSFFGKFLSNPLHIQIASFLLIFIILLGLSAVLGKIFMILPEDVINIFEHIFAAVIGFMKGIIYVGLALIVAAHFIKPLESVVDESLLGNKLSELVKEGIEILGRVAK